MARIHIRRRSWFALLLVIVLAGVALVPASAAPRVLPGVGTVNAFVYYRTGPDVGVSGVEVWLRDTTNGVSYYACTNANGKATFSGIPAGANLISAAGKAVSEMCDNADFVRPDDRRKMFWMAYENHSQGTGGFTNFFVGAGESKVIKFWPVTAADQVTICAGMPTTEIGTSGDDYIKGTPGDDVINAREGNDIIFGLDGNDIICGGSGNDVLFGDDGNDYLVGEAGDDQLIGDKDHDWLVGGEGADWLVGRSGDDTSIGQGGAPDKAVKGPGTDRCQAATTEVCKGWTTFQ
jgi:Ca2+-binding RTX toxin-like protein